MRLGRAGLSMGEVDGGHGMIEVELMGEVRPLWVVVG